MTNTEQPEALRFAEALERRGYASLTMETRLTDRDIAAELRRLHAENEALRVELAEEHGLRMRLLNAAPQPSAEPVALRVRELECVISDLTAECKSLRKLLHELANRKPLRGEEIYKIACRVTPRYADNLSFVPEWAIPLAREIEAAHGIGGKHD